MSVLWESEELQIYGLPVPNVPVSFCVVQGVRRLDELGRSYRCAVEQGGGVVLSGNTHFNTMAHLKEPILLVCIIVGYLSKTTRDAGCFCISTLSVCDFVKVHKRS